VELKTPKQLFEQYIQDYYLDKQHRISLAHVNYSILSIVYHVILSFGLLAIIINYFAAGVPIIFRDSSFLYYLSYLCIGSIGILLSELLRRYKPKSLILTYLPYYLPFVYGYSLCLYVFVSVNNIFSGIVGFATVGLISIMCLQIEPVVFCVVLAVFYGVIFGLIRDAFGVIGVMDVGVLNILFMVLSFIKRKNTKFEMLRTQTLEEDRDEMKNELAEQNQRIIDMQNNTIISLSNLVENRDSDTGEHVRRTSAYVNLIARKALVNGIYTDQIDEEFISTVTKAAPMHDIGKIVIPDKILKKPGKLTSEEFDEVKKHTIEGGRIVQEIFGKNEDEAYLNMTKDIVLAHHEKWDGTGYPYGLKGDAIPLSARIMAIADVFDALVSPRCYKLPFSLEKAMEIIKEESGSHFDPKLAELFLSMEDDALAIMDMYRD